MTRLALAALAALLAGPVEAQTVFVCAPTAEMLVRHETMFGETPEIVATRDELRDGQPASRVVTIVVNPKTRTWTALLQRDPATMCDVGWNGGNWTVVRPNDVVPEPPKPQQYFRPDDEGRWRYFIPIGLR